MCIRRWIGAIAMVLALLTAARSPEARTEASHVGIDCGIRLPSAQNLATVFNTRNADVHCLDVELDPNRDITGIRIKTYDASAGARSVHVTRLRLAAINAASGAVLDGRPGHAALILQGHIAKNMTQARLNVRYLYNGLTGQFRSCPIQLHKKASGQWVLFNGQDRVVSRIVIETWRLPLIGTVGIKTLEGVCTA